MNKITATGRVAADAEVRHTSSGDAICNFRMASDVGFGERKSTNWFNCTVWGKRGEAVAEYLTKGTPITAFGTLTLREWVSKEGIKQLSPDIRIDEVTLHGSRDSGAQSGDYAPQQNQQRTQAPQQPAQNQYAQQSGGGMADLDSDEIPF